MATGGGVKEVGVRLKVGATGTEAVDRLGAQLRDLGVDTEALDRKAEELGRELQTTGRASGELADTSEALAPVQREVAQATDDVAQAARAGAGGLGEMSASGDDARRKLGEMKLELAAAAATAYTIGRALGNAAGAASGFEVAMAEVSTLLDDTSGVDGLAESVRALAREYGGSAPDQAKALYQIISAGASDAAQATSILDTANRLAVGGVTDITTAADGLTSILNAYGDAAGSAGDVSDALFTAMRAGKTTVGELSSSIGQVAPIASQAGVSLEEVLSATAALTKGGASTSQSVTQLRGIISSIIKPSGEAQKAAQELGLQFDAAALKSKGLAGFLQEVALKTGGNTEIMATLFGQVEALGGVLALTGSQADSFAEILDGMGRRAGATDEAFGKMAETSGFAGERFKAAMADVQISLGQALTAFTPLLEAATSAINLFNELPGPIKSTAAGAVALAVAIGPVVFAIGNLTRAAGLAATALGLKAAAATAVVAPARAAAGATAAMGVAAGAATGPITAAATATTLLSRALLALRAALPIGLLLTVASLAYEFFRAKKAAEDGDEAVRKMLETPVRPALPAAAQEAATALAGVGDAAAAGQKALAQQETTARLAARALGVDLAGSAKVVTAEFSTKLQRLDELTGGLRHLRDQGVDTGKVLREALQGMIEAARNQTELDELRKRIEALGKAGEVSQAQVDALLDSIKRKAAEGKETLTELEQAMKRFGLTTKDEAKKLADELGRAWQVIRNDAGVTLEQKQAAFKRYADAAVAANGGVADSSLKAQASALGLTLEFDKTGRLIVKAMGDAERAVEGVRKKVDETGREVNRMGEYINQLAGAIGKLENYGMQRVRGPGESAGPSVLDWSGRDTTHSVTLQAVPPREPGPWVYTMVGYQIPGRTADGKRLAGGWRRPEGWRPAPGSGLGGAYGGFAGSPQQAAEQAAAKTVRVELSVNGRAPIPVETSPTMADQLIRELEDAMRASGAGP